MNKDKHTSSVAIIILNWNGLEDTRECLLSLQKIDYPRYKVIVVDNGSSGNDIELLKEQFGEYIDIVVNERNLGYAKGVNIGVKTAREKYAPDYYLLLNNDTIVDAGFLSKLVEALESNGMAGIVGPKVYYYDAPQVLQSLGANINMYTGTVSYPGLKQKDVGQYDKISAVDWVGPCTLIKAEVFNKIGYFDEGYFAYWEDVDFCVRAKRNGYSSLYIPGSRIWHKLGSASLSVSGRMYYFMARNRINFMRKNATKFQYACFMIYLTLFHMWATAVYLLMSRGIQYLKAFWRGTWDGLKNEDKYSSYYI